MTQKLDAQKTVVTTQDMLTALGTAWANYFHNPPTKEQICILIAQWALETGWGKFMWNYNIGNAKSVNSDGRDYTFFTCNEILPIATAQKMLAASPGLVEIRSTTGTTANTYFHPEHPACRFRAFTTLALGAADYLDLLVNRFSDDNQEKNAWHWVTVGDPSAFCHALKLKGYYTADEGQYTNIVLTVYKKLLADNTLDLSQIPSFTSDEQDHMSGWNSLVTQQGIEKALDDQANADPETPPDETQS